MNPYIFIRFDASKSIGLGHLKRAQIIAEYLQKVKGIRSLLISRIDKQSLFFINNEKFELYQIEDNIKINDELKILNDLSQSYNPIYFILDVLENDIIYEYMKGLKSLNIPIFAITDDSKKRDIDANLVLNGNPNQIGINYDSPNKYLLGPKFFIMNPNYMEINSHKPVNIDKKHVLITLGGSDHNNILFKSIEALNMTDVVKEITIISSKATGYSSKLDDFVTKLDKEVSLYFDVFSLAPYFQKSDLAITSGGNTLFERIATGLPGATICQLVRQMEIADKFEELDVNINIGYGPMLSIEEIHRKVISFIGNHKCHMKQYDNSKKIVDGKGLIRFANEIDFSLK